MPVDGAAARMINSTIASLAARADPDPDWPTKDIVYVCVVGTIMLMALLEWFLWLGAFLYCMYKVFLKAQPGEKVSTRVLVIVISAIFTCLRVTFLPVMVVTLPLPNSITKYFPHEMVKILQYFAFWSFAGLLVVPWLMAIYQLVRKNVGREARLKRILSERTAPKLVIVMPTYNESADILVRTIDSVADAKYPQSCLHVFLSFDGHEESEAYLQTIERLGIPMTMKSYPSCIDLAYRNMRITVSRFPHGGKRECQKRTFKLIDKVYTRYIKRYDNMFVLFIDSDCILHEQCIQNFMYEMELRPGSKRDMMAMTGVITSTADKNSLLTLIQDQEYVHGQLFERSVESGCGAVTCLPGALTLLRFNAFKKLSKYYFADNTEKCEDLFDYCKCHLGEDRWLTHLFMIAAEKKYQISMNTGAFCKTEAVTTFKNLLKQRRRWFLGFITNEACMLTDIRLWRRYPVLLLIRLAQNTIRTTALLFFIMCISLMTTVKAVKDLPVGFIGVSLGCNWALMGYFAWQLGRWKLLLYPVMFVVNPFLNWMYMVYGICTAGQRTWGGPRADAAKASALLTPREAVEVAQAGGDDLNIIPESFKPATEARLDQEIEPISLHPLGQSVPAQVGGYLELRSDAGLGLANDQYNSTSLRRNRTVPTPRIGRRDLRDEDTSYVPHHLDDNVLSSEQYANAFKRLTRSKSSRLPSRGIPLHPQPSFESLHSRQSTTTDFVVPRRPESFMEDEDVRDFKARQRMIVQENPEGGAGYASPGPSHHGKPVKRIRSLTHKVSSGSSKSKLDADDIKDDHA